MGELTGPIELTDSEMEAVAGGITVSNTGTTTSGVTFFEAGVAIDSKET
jgi:hypothetical protein